MLFDNVLASVGLLSSTLVVDGSVKGTFCVLSGLLDKLSSADKLSFDDPFLLVDASLVFADSFSFDDKLSFVASLSSLADMLSFADGPFSFLVALHIQR